jgi:hypothetical protein
LGRICYPAALKAARASDILAKTKLIASERSQKKFSENIFVVAAIWLTDRRAAQQDAHS